MEDFKAEIEHLRKSEIPRCIYCKKNFVNTKDTRTGEISKYLWKPDCKCVKKDFTLCLG